MPESSAVRTQASVQNKFNNPLILKKIRNIVHARWTLFMIFSNRAKNLEVIMVLAGNRNTTGGFNNRSSNANLWSSLPSGGNAWNRNLNSGNATVNRNTNNKANGFSVRCLKNFTINQCWKITTINNWCLIYFTPIMTREKTSEDPPVSWLSKKIIKENCSNFLLKL